MRPLERLTKRAIRNRITARGGQFGNIPMTVVCSLSRASLRSPIVEGEPIHGEEMFVARCEHIPELAMAESSPQKAYDGLMAMIEKVWAAKVAQSEKLP